MAVARFALILFLVCLVPISALKLPDPNKIWAVLVAGSLDYGNYRHQADVCHSYHVLRDHGVPEEQIIVMMVDDIAHNILNPTKGILVNRPDGQDVYEGVVKDYVGMDVNVENFVNIILGNENAMQNIGSGKVLKSGLDNHVFLSYVDHGGPGFLTFPYDYIYAKNFSTVLHLMHDMGLYGQMTLYIEACNAGSMTEGGLLPPNVYSVTAAGPDEQSMACCYDIVRDTTVGDVFSVKWMEDSDMQDIRIETLDTQFAIVRQETVTSVVHRYGDLRIAEQPVGEFQGMVHKNQSETKSLPGTIMQELIPSREIPLYVLKKKLEQADTPEAAGILQKSIDQLLSKRAFLAEKVTEIVSRSVENDDRTIDQVLNEKLKLRDYTCYGEVLEYFNDNCFSLSRNGYVGTYAHTLINMCEIGVSSDTMKDAMDETCTFTRMEGIE